MTTFERIKMLAKKRRKSLNDVERDLGYGKNVLYRLKNTNPSTERLQEIANYFDVSVDFLLGREATNIVRVSGKTVKIPILGTITCGEPILAEQNIEDYREEISELLPSGELFYLKTKGDSMVPTIPENSFVLIRRQEEVEDGEIAAVIVNGNDEATLKRVKHQGDVVMLFADNSKYAPIIITPDTPARIIGKAVKVSMDL